MDKRDTIFTVSFIIGILASFYFLIASAMDFLFKTVTHFPKSNIAVHGLSTAAILAMGLLYLTAKKGTKKK